MIAAAVAASCAYYNIFWMARNEYEAVISGEDARDFRDPFAQKKVTGQNAKLVDSVIQRCGKLLLLHGKSKWVDDALLMMGNCFVLKQEYGMAMRKYDELLNLYGSSELVEEARYMRAYTLILQGSTRQALTELDALAGAARHKIVREKAAYLRARVHHHNEDCEKAIEYFKAYVAAYPEGRATGEVMLDLGECLLNLDRASEVITALDPLAKRNDVAAPMAGLLVGKAHRRLGQHERAIEVLGNLAEMTDVDTVKIRAKIEIADVLLEESKPNDAIEILNEADTLATKDLRDLDAEVTYRIGVVYEKHLGDFDRATASYDLAAESPSKFGRLAGRRSRALGKIRTYKEALSDSIPDSPEDEAMNRFLLAEVYLQDLGFADEALEQYRVVADSLPTSAYGARSMLAAAALLEGRNDSLARAYYRTVIDSFPNTVHANLARTNLDLPLRDIVVEVPEATSGPDTGSASDVSASAVAPRDSVAADSTRSLEEKPARPSAAPPTSRPELVGPPVPQEIPEADADTGEDAPAAPAPDDTLETPPPKGPE